MGTDQGERESLTSRVAGRITDLTIRRVPLQHIIMPFVLLLLCAYFALATDNFLTVANWSNVIRQIATLAFLAMAMTLIIISGGIDISVGAVIAFVSMVTADVMLRTNSITIGFGAGLLAGLAFGALNGVLVARYHVPAFVTTLGTQAIARGSALLYGGGMAITGLPIEYGRLGTGFVGPVPVALIVTVVGFIVVGGLLHRTVFGRYIFAVGGDEEAAMSVGVNVTQVKLRIFMVGGLLTGMGGVIMSSRILSGHPALGLAMELDAIAAVVIGGGRLGGGRGTIFGTIVGVLILGVIRNGLNLMRVSSYVQEVIIGIIIIAGVLLDMMQRRDKGVKGVL